MMMSKFGSARAALAVAAVAALAGCSASASSSVPPSSGISSTASGTSSTANASTASTASTPSASSNAFVPAGSAPFPIAVGNTWIYQTTTDINGARGLQTSKVLSVTPVSGGSRVVMSETSDLSGANTTSEQAYVFYSNGTIGYPVAGSEVSVLGSGVLWPNAADLASGRAYRSVLRVKVNNTSPVQQANVTVQGLGTHTVTVPAGTYQATLVTMIMSIRVGSFGSDEEIQTWTAPGTGPVKSEVLLLTGGRAKLTTTEELVSFTKG